MWEIVGLVVVWLIVAVGGAICVGVPFVVSGFTLIQRVEYTERRVAFLVGLSLLPGFGLPFWIHDLLSPRAVWITYVWPIVFAPGAVFSLASIVRFSLYRSRWIATLLVFFTLIFCWTYSMTKYWGKVAQIPPHPENLERTAEWTRISRRVDKKIVAYSKLNLGIEGTFLPDFMVGRAKGLAPCGGMTESYVGAGEYPTTLFSEDGCDERENYGYFVPGVKHPEFRLLDMKNASPNTAQELLLGSSENPSLKLWLKNLQTTPEKLSKSSVQTYLTGGEADVTIGVFKLYHDLNAQETCEGPAIVWIGQHAAAVVPACVGSFQPFILNDKLYLHFLSMDYSAMRPGGEETNPVWGQYIFRIENHKATRID